MASSCSFDKFPGTIVTGIGNVPELLDWLNKMYEILGSQPPLPEELTTEDFDMFFGDS